MHALLMSGSVLGAACLEPNPGWDELADSASSSGPSASEAAGGEASTSGESGDTDASGDATETATGDDTSTDSGAELMCGDDLPVADQLCFESPPRLSELGAGALPQPIELQDIDADGRCDWLVGDANQDELWRHGGDLGLTVNGNAWERVAGAQNPDDIAVGDFDGLPEQLLEVVATDDRANQNLLSYENDGPLQPPMFRDGGDGLRGVDSGDLTGDGLHDLIAASENTGELYLLYGLDPDTQGSGTGLSIPFGAGTFDAELGDVDGDGWLDAIAVAREGAHVGLLLNNGAGDLSVDSTTGVSPNPERVALADWVGDDTLEVAVAHELGISIYRLTIAATTQWELVVEHNIDGGARDLVVADLDGDGDPDLAVLGRTLAVVHLFADVGESLEAAGTLGLSSPGFGIAAADIDNDGDVDIGVTLPDSAQIAVFPGNP